MSLWAKIAVHLARAINRFKSEPFYKYPIWLKVAQGQIGVSEIPGTVHNQAIIDYHQTTSLKATRDEVAWCSSFVNWVMLQAGIKGTNSAAARSWLEWGIEIEDPKPGAVVVLSRGRNPALGHVGIFMGFANNRKSIRLLGGNQNNKVSVQNFSVNRIISYRWPKF